MRNRYKCYIGTKYLREDDPEQLPEFTTKAEAAGFDKLWVVEDCFYRSGIATTAVA